MDKETFDFNKTITDRMKVVGATRVLQDFAKTYCSFVMGSPFEGERAYDLLASLAKALRNPTPRVR